MMGLKLIHVSCVPEVDAMPLVIKRCGMKCGFQGAYAQFFSHFLVNNRIFYNLHGIYAMKKWVTHVTSSQFIKAIGKTLI